MKIRDPRPFQIAVLSGLLCFGLVAGRIATAPLAILSIVASALLTQSLWSRRCGLRFDWRSPLISALSICLLGRADVLWPLLVAAVIAISSKFLIRFKGKHVFNPTNFGLLAAAVLTDRLWLSPGQWGSGANFAFFLACAGLFVTYRAARTDVTWAFLSAYAGLLFTRALWLGDPLTIPMHALNSGSLILFAFFMISDPKTTPDSRPGRIVYAALVALGAAFVHFVLYRENGLLWSLVACAPLVPVIDWLLPGERYRWPIAEVVARSLGRFPLPRPAAASRTRDRRSSGLPSSSTANLEAPMSLQSSTRPGTRPLSSTALVGWLRGALLLSLLVAGLLLAGRADAFCGFYVARADTKLYNKASQVVLVRDGDRTVLTMANDFRGDLDEFAIVIPVPTFLEREQIHVAEQRLIDHLDAYTSPRLVEYFDSNPCAMAKRRELERRFAAQSAPMAARDQVEEDSDLGVVIEAKYTVGEYDILILSAEESRGLETWLRRNGYRIPKGASEVLGSYLRQGMRFFVAKVNLDEQSKLGYNNLRPIQVAYESPKFMLPIRLGMVNADGAQELFVYTLTKKGRVETTNYRTVKLPTGMDIPVFVKNEFGDFYRDLFTEQVKKERMRSVFLEYAWDMAWCDPCAADPLSADELRELGVFWLPAGAGRSPAQNVFVTRLHVRYDQAHFPDDLRFQQTADRSNFQGRYVLRHPWTGNDSCQAADQYRAQLPARLEREAQTLASLTGWSIRDIRAKMGDDWPSSAEPAEDKKWWQKLWPGR